MRKGALLTMSDNRHIPDVSRVAHELPDLLDGEVHQFDGSRLRNWQESRLLVDSTRGRDDEDSGTPLRQRRGLARPVL